MRYTVDILGESIVVDVRDGATGLEVAVGDEPHVAARLVPAPAPLHTLVHGERRRRLIVAEDAHDPGTFRVVLDGGQPVRVVALDELTRATAAARQSAGGSGPRSLRAVMPGVVAELRVEAGQQVTKGQVLLILEAMKMQNEIAAPGDAVVESIAVSAGEAVAAGAKLIEFAAPDAE